MEHNDVIIVTGVSFALTWGIWPSKKGFLDLTGEPKIKQLEGFDPPEVSQIWQGFPGNKQSWKEIGMVCVTPPLLIQDAYGLPLLTWNFSMGSASADIKIYYGIPRTTIVYFYFCLKHNDMAWYSKNYHYPYAPHHYN